MHGPYTCNQYAIKTFILIRSKHGVMKKRFFFKKHILDIVDSSVFSLSPVILPTDHSQFLFE